MTKLRPGFAALIVLLLLPVVLLLSPIPARPQPVSRMFSADFYLAGCKDFLAGKSSFFGGRCVGAVEVLDALNSDTKLFCPPENATNLQRVQTIVSYIEARPDRKSADFRLVANEAMAKAWPCKK
jgi:Rap1a immunity proteins